MRESEREGERKGERERERGKGCFYKAVRKIAYINVRSLRASCAFAFSILRGLGKFSCVVVAMWKLVQSRYQPLVKGMRLTHDCKLPLLLRNEFRIDGTCYAAKYIGQGQKSCIPFGFASLLGEVLWPRLGGIVSCPGGYGMRRNVSSQQHAL